MLRRPPAPPLFPYTTLFRSGTMDCSPSPTAALSWIRLPLNLPRSPSLPPLDRKSTRLNSSHVSISYAVFCLKKKNLGHGHTPDVRVAPSSALSYDASFARAR